MVGATNIAPTDCNMDSEVQIQHRRVVIQNSYKEKLFGILHETGSTEVVIVCHGFRSCKDRIPMVNLATAFANEGITAFRFDFAGYGEGSFQYGNYYREVDDLQTVMQYFEHEKRSVAAIIGHSKGRNVVLFYASRFHNVHNVVNLSGRFNLKRGIEVTWVKITCRELKNMDSLMLPLERVFLKAVSLPSGRGNIEYRVTEDSLMDRLTTNPSAACQLIPQNCRVLTIHGSANKIVPMEDAKEFAKHILNHDLHIINGADHEYTSHQNELASIVLDFVKAGSYARAADKSLRSSL